MLCALGSARSWCFCLLVPGTIFISTSNSTAACNAMQCNAVARGAIIGHILTVIHFPIVVVFIHSPHPQVILALFILFFGFLLSLSVFDCEQPILVVSYCSHSLLCSTPFILTGICSVSFASHHRLSSKRPTFRHSESSSKQRRYSHLWKNKHQTRQFPYGRPPAIHV